MAASKSSSGKKKGGGSSSSGRGTAGSMLSTVVGGAGADTILDLVERLGLVDVVLGRVKSRIEETDIDEVLDDVADYLRRNPEVLVVSLGAVTIATGLLVWLNKRREWDGSERRNTGGSSTTSSPGKVKRTTSARNTANYDSDDDE